MLSHFSKGVKHIILEEIKQIGTKLILSYNIWFLKLVLMN